MSYPEYATILEAIVTGFVISLILNKWGKLMVGKISAHWIPILWSVLLMAHIIFRWWFDFHYRIGDLHKNTDFEVFLYFMARPFLIYMSTIVVFGKSKHITLDNFLSFARTVFIVMGIMWAYDVIDWTFIREKAIFGGPQRIQPLLNLIMAFLVVYKPTKTLLFLATFVALISQIIVLVFTWIW